MKATLIVLTCSLLAAACANSDERSAQRTPARAGESVETDHPSFGNNASAGRPSTMAPDRPGEARMDAAVENAKSDDRERSVLTPMNQGNSAQETDITAAIRRSVMSDKTLSLAGKNIEIITQGDRVTLRGPVKSGREKRVIESLARNTEGVAVVDDQIEVQRQTDSK